MRALLLPVGDDLYAIELTQVREVVPAPVVTPIPSAPVGVHGVFNLRGQVVPLLDTAALLGVGGGAPVDHVAVAMTDLGLAGLAVEAVPSQVDLGARAGDSELEHGVGRFALDGSLATLVDVDSLVAEVRRR